MIRCRYLLLPIQRGKLRPRRKTGGKSSAAELISVMENFDEQLRHIAVQHKISETSARQLVQGLLRTGGGQVQFDVPEFGGMGQWMPGMVMAGSLFDHGLKARVDAVCSDISQQVRSGGLRPPAVVDPIRHGQASLTWDRSGNWWPGDLGIPAASGGQNDMRYAWFPSSRRLAVDLGGRVWVYDTADHNIGGVSQQQSGGHMVLAFTSQHGTVDISSLAVVSRGDG